MGISLLRVIISASESLPFAVDDSAIPSILVAENEESDERLKESDFAILIGRKSGLITYLGPNGNIFTVNQAGRNGVAITDDSNLEQIEDLNVAPLARYYLLPAWSTSGQRLAFAQHFIADSRDQDFAQRKGELVSISEFQPVGNASLPANTCDLPPATCNLQQQPPSTRTSTYSIFAADADGANQQLLWSGTARPIYMYWGPDGVTLSVLLQEPNAASLQFALLNTADRSVEIIDEGGPLYWDWSPNGRQILTHIGSNPATERVSMLSLEGEVIEEIWDVQPARFTSPDISADGKFLAIPIRADAEDDDDTWLAVYNLRTRNKSIIDKIDGDILIGGAFSPNSKQYGYIVSGSAAGSLPTGELAVFTLASGDLTISESNDIGAFFWSPDGTKIAMFELLEPESEDNPSGRPQLGLSVLDVETGAEVDLIQPFETTVQFNEVLTFYNQYQRSATIWSPDSRTLVLPVRTADGAKIITIDASGTIQPRTLAPGVLAFWSAE